jgi:AraC-like DNA-binding protein
VCKLLQDDPADGRTLTELGREIGASERTLSRLCKADLGMTFPQWRTQLRLHLASRLLAEGHSVTGVAHQCGWASTSAFIDTFRRAFGQTPGSRRA